MSPFNPSPDPTEFTEKQLKLAYWYVSHKVLLKKILIASLITLSAVFWIYGIYGLINYFFIEQVQFDRMLKEISHNLINYSGFRAENQPQDFKIISSSVLPSGKDKYDLTAKVSNPNPNWRAEFEYKFIFDGEETVSQKGFILPGEEKFLLGLAVESKKKPQQVNLDLQNIKWQRLDPHQISDYASWSKERLNFEITEIKFLPAVIKDKVSISKVTFSAANRTAYNFWSVGFYILLYRGTSLAGVNYITLEQFISGMKRDVEVSWVETMPTITRVQILPEVNIFDPAVYMPVR
jgi:hypothetical protein